MNARVNSCTFFYRIIMEMRLLLDRVCDECLRAQCAALCNGHKREKQNCGKQSMSKMKIETFLHESSVRKLKKVNNFNLVTDFDSSYYISKMKYNISFVIKLLKSVFSYCIHYI